ncbi:discoidin domain-containing protein, partial [Candidatus Aquicultor sp.]
MGLRVMDGDFPIFFMAQNYMGSMEAYLTGSFFLFFGPSHLTLDLLAVIFSILFLILLYLLSKTFFGYKTALISIALLAIPPWFLTTWSHEARLHYHFVIIFGNFLLLISHKTIYRQDIRPERKRILLVLIGLLSGIGWWNNFLIIAYLIPIGFFLFLRDKKILFGKNFLFLLFPFLLGSSPLWTFNVIHDYPILSLLGSPPPTDRAINVIHDFSIIGLIKLWDVSHSMSYIKDFFINAFPFIIGFVPPLSKDKMDFTGYLIIGPIYLIALIYFIYKSRLSLKSFFFLRLTKTSSGEILVLLFFVNILLNLFTPYGRFLSKDDQRYLLPLYTCLPIFVSVFLRDIGKKYQLLSLFLLGLILLSNVSGNLKQEDAWLVFNPDKFLAAQKNLAKENRITAFLIKNGYTRIYSFIDSRYGNGITFNSQESIICAHPSLESYPKYADLVDASSKVSFLSFGEDKVFEENLKAIGGYYRKITAPDGYLLYTDFKPPQTAYRMIPRHLWRGSSNLNSSEAQNAFDGDVSTGWSTRGPQKKGTYFLLDLGREETVGKVSWIPASFSHVPKGYRVDVSLDGKNWQIVTNLPEYKCPTDWSGPHPIYWSGPHPM